MVVYNIIYLAPSSYYLLGKLSFNNKNPGGGGYEYYALIAIPYTWACKQGIKTFGNL